MRPAACRQAYWAEVWRAIQDLNLARICGLSHIPVKISINI
jgi:hypothetical protein